MPLYCLLQHNATPDTLSGIPLIGGQIVTLEQIMDYFDATGPELADMLSEHEQITHQGVYLWRNRGVPMKWQKRIERMSGGALEVGNE